MFLEKNGLNRRQDKRYIVLSLNGSVYPHQRSNGYNSVFIGFNKIEDGVVTQT